MDRHLQRDDVNTVHSDDTTYRHLELFRDVDIWVDAGATLLAEGVYNDSIYVVLDGELQVRIGATNAAPLRCLGVGACVGERSILS